MTKVPEIPTKRYAVYNTEDGAAIYGQAELLRGFGWIFRSDDGLWMAPLTREEVMRGKADLFGWVELSDGQVAADTAKREAEVQAGTCQACGMIGCRGDATCEATQHVLTQLAAVMA
jgi:hypothetical protein